MGLCCLKPFPVLFPVTWGPVAVTFSNTTRPQTLSFPFLFANSVLACIYFFLMPHYKWKEQSNTWMSISFQPLSPGVRLPSPWSARQLLQVMTFTNFLPLHNVSLPFPLCNIHVHVPCCLITKPVLCSSGFKLRKHHTSRC